MKGYKAMNSDYSTQFGNVYEVGKTYSKDGKIIYGKNGYHFCVYPEDTFRYYNGYRDFKLVLVDGRDDLYERRDEYNEFFENYVCRTIEFEREISREELFNIMINSNQGRLKRFISLVKLTEEEKEEVLNRYPDLKEMIDIYQSEEFVLKRKLDI